MMSRRVLFALVVMLLSGVTASAWERSIVTDDEFKSIIGRKPERKNPHSTSEFKLMTKGSKRLAYISDPEMIEQFRETGEFEIDRFHDEVYLIYRKEHADLAAEWRNTYKLFQEKKITSDQANRRCGELLGYTDTQINAFMGRPDGMR